MFLSIVSFLFFIQTKVASPTSAAAAALNNPFLSSPTNSSANIVDMFGGVPSQPQAQSKASDDLLQLGNPFADMFSASAPVQAPAANNLWMNNGKNSLF